MDEKHAFGRLGFTAPGVRIKMNLIARMIRYVQRRKNRYRAVPKSQLKMKRLYQVADRFDIPILKEGFSLIRYKSGFEQQWVDLLNESGEFGFWDVPKLSGAILSTLLPEGGVLVAKNDKLVSCSAVCLKEKFAPLAILLNVVVLPEYRGQGIAKVIISESNAVCHRQGIPGIILYTDNFRLTAIRSYLALGFRPDLGASSDAEKRWDQVFMELGNYKIDRIENSESDSGC